MDALKFIIGVALAACCMTAQAGADESSFGAMLARCVPDASPVTMTALLRQESAFDRYAINDNDAGGVIAPPATEADAVAVATRLLKAGHNIDVGLGQINSANFGRLSVPWTELFKPCTNLKAAALILRECYARALPKFGTKQRALRAALSCYNTGNFSDGFSNGYVQKVAQKATLPIPALLPVGEPAAVTRIPQKLRVDNRPPIVLRSDAEQAATSPLFVSNKAMPEASPHADDSNMPKGIFVYPDTEGAGEAKAETPVEASSRAGQKAGTAAPSDPAKSRGAKNESGSL